MKSDMGFGTAKEERNTRDDFPQVTQGALGGIPAAARLGMVAEHHWQVQRILQEPPVDIAVAVAVPLVLPGHQVASAAACHSRVFAIGC